MLPFGFNTFPNGMLCLERKLTYMENEMKRIFGERKVQFVIRERLNVLFVGLFCLHFFFIFFFFVIHSIEMCGRLRYLGWVGIGKNVYVIHEQQTNLTFSQYKLSLQISIAIDSNKGTLIETFFEISDIS